MRLGTDVVHGIPTELGATMVHDRIEDSVESEMQLLNKTNRKDVGRQSHFQKTQWATLQENEASSSKGEAKHRGQVSHQKVAEDSMHHVNVKETIKQMGLPASGSRVVIGNVSDNIPITQA